MIGAVEERDDTRTIEDLRALIDDDSYLADAIARIAQVLSDELIGARLPGALHERER